MREIMARTVWGVDSAATVTDQSFYCVKNELGYPKFWGRYLVEVPNVSDGLTAQEIARLHSYGIKILPIYNAFRQATGYANGQVVARNAVFHARRLGIPKNKMLFANIEDFLLLMRHGFALGWKRFSLLAIVLDFMQIHPKGISLQLIAKQYKKITKWLFNPLFGVQHRDPERHPSKKLRNILRLRQIVKRMYGPGNTDVMPKHALSTPT